MPRYRKPLFPLIDRATPILDRFRDDRKYLVTSSGQEVPVYVSSTGGEYVFFYRIVEPLDPSDVGQVLAWPGGLWKWPLHFGWIDINKDVAYIAPHLEPGTRNLPDLVVNEAVRLLAMKTDVTRSSPYADYWIDWDLDSILEGSDGTYRYRTMSLVEMEDVVGDFKAHWNIHMGKLPSLSL